MHSLPLFMRLAGRPVLLLGAGEAADAKRRLLERAGAAVTDDEGAGAVLAVVAIDGPAADAAATRLKARGLLVNVVDRPELCDFTTPAIVDRAPVLIAIATGGASAGLAKALRQRLEALLPDRLGALADSLAAARPRLKTRWPRAADRRRAIDAALDPGGPLDPFRADAALGIDDWLTADPDTAPAGRLELVRITSDDPDELTLRAARLLGQADALWHAPGIAPAVLNRARADAERHAAAAPPPVPSTGLSLWLHR